MRSLGRGPTVILVVALTTFGCRRSSASNASDDATSVASFMSALKPAVDAFETSQTTNCQKDRLRSIGGDAPVFVDVDAARAYFSGAPAASRFPLASGESVPAEDVANLDARQRKRAGDAARYAASVPLWGLYRTDRLELPSVGMAEAQPKTFVGGKVSIVMNLVERATGATLCTLHVDAESSATVKVTTKPEGKMTGPGADLLDNARRNLERSLRQVGR